MLVYRLTDDALTIGEYNDWHVDGHKPEWLRLDGCFQRHVDHGDEWRSGQWQWLGRLQDCLQHRHRLENRNVDGGR